MIPLDAELLHALFEYRDGKLFNRVHRHYSSPKGAPVGGLRRDGYLQLWVGRHILVHRIVWALFHGDPAGAQIDHINGIRSDNRIENLRLASPTENRRNQTRIRSDNSSGVHGVSRHKATGKWEASIQVKGKRKHLGVFVDINEARAVRLEATKRHFGKFGVLREPY